MTAPTTPADLFERYCEAPTVAEAEEALEALAAAPAARAYALGDYFDELAELAADDQDYARAARLELRAIELGCERPQLAREMRGWYLLRDGQTVAGEAEFAALRGEVGDDPQLLIMLGSARADAGREEDALTAFDEALGAAKEIGDRGVIEHARAERKYSREQLGLPPDDDDRAAPVPIWERRFERTVYALSWFPREERDRALELWPDLSDDLADPDAYCGMIERRLRETRVALGRTPEVAPLYVDRLVEFASSEGLEPGDAEARAGLAAELRRRGETILWPPSRNDPCWCGSGRKYKRCCGQA
jgi:tetratricopeptide (TPR) repeat protein